MSATFAIDLKNALLAQQSFVPLARTATANGTGVDMLKTDGPIHALLDVGAVSGTTPTLDVKLQESDDNSTFTDISGATFTQVTAANKLFWLSTNLRQKRYVRAVATIAGTTPSFTLSVTVHGRLKITGSGAGTSLYPDD